MLWSGLSTIGEGAMTALGGASTALGAVGHVATSTLGAVSGTLASGSKGISGIGLSIGIGKGSSRSKHTKAASESVVHNPVGSFLSTLVRSPVATTTASTASLPSPSPLPSPSALPPQSKGSRSSLVIKLSPSTSQSSLESIIGGGNSSPIHQLQPRSRHSLDSSSRALSATASLLSTPFTSIAAAASAAAGQVPLEEINDKIDKASSLLNSLRYSLFEELAHLQDHHTRELERAMRDFGARQLQIERSRLRDMMEILDELQIGVNTTSSATAVASESRPESRPGLRLRSISQPGSRGDPTVGRTSRGMSRRSSHGALTPGIGPSHHRTATGFPFGSEMDEKTETREQQRRHELQRRRSGTRPNRRDEREFSQGVDSTNPGTESDHREKDTISEKMPLDD
ncbi:MAG: hypothetical protein J3Q66DRAFT_179908 [Benniella sp.]|nr:MAG: hypothetical protein J3Q66DRAFT_179908 [Benniella sp.]